MGSENSADQAWALVASWSLEGCDAVVWGMGAIIRGLRQPERPDAAMQETQILSTRPALLPEPTPRGASVGRALVFGAAGPGDWLARLALLTGGALPATLAWLVTACSLKKGLQRLREPLQYAAGVLLGMLAGLYACAMLVLAGTTAGSPPWLACAASGALLSALLVTALRLRARRSEEHTSEL